MSDTVGGSDGTQVPSAYVGSQSGVADIAGGFQSPDLSIPYIMPANIPASLQAYIQPIYTNFQNIIQALINQCGIAPRAVSQAQLSNDDPTAFLANNVHRFYCQSTEFVAYGAPVNLYNYGGNLCIRNASAADGTKPAMGFCSTAGGIENGIVGEVIIGEGVVYGFTGLTPGQQYYLGITPGSYNPSAPTATGALTQAIAYALTDSALLFNCYSGFGVGGGGGSGGNNPLNAQLLKTDADGNLIPVIVGDHLEEVYDPVAMTWTLNAICCGADMSNFDLYIYSPGVLTANQKVWSGRCARPITFPANMTGGFGSSNGTTATAATTLTLLNAGTPFGILTFAAGSGTGTYTTSGLTTAAGDRLAILGPGSPDATLGYLEFTWLGTV